MNRSHVVFLLLAVLLTLDLLSLARDARSLIRHGVTGHQEANLYYDAYHGARHLWNRDNRRHRIAYHTVSGYSRFYHALQEEGFDVDVVTGRGFDRAILDGYDVFFIGEQTYHARFMTEKEQRELVEWVKDGGGLFAVVEHTNAHYMADVFDLLFKDLPVRGNRDSIADLDQSQPLSPTWVDLPVAKDHPVTRGVKEYRFYNGCTLDTDHGVLFSSKTSWSDRFNPRDKPIQNGNKKRDPDEKPGPHAGIAAFTHGKGRVVVVGDHNAFANPNLYWGDHHRLGMNAMAWLAGSRVNPHLYLLFVSLATLLACIFLARKLKVPAWRILGVSLLAAAVIAAGWIGTRPASVDLFVHLGNDPQMKYMTKEPGGYFTLYGQWTKEPQLKPWASTTLKPGHDALFLSAPRKRFSGAQLAVMDDYLARGKTVVYMASIDSLESEAGKQLQEKFAFRANLDRTLKLKKGRTPFLLHGPEALVEGLFRVYVYSGTPGVTVEGLTHVVHLTRGGYHIEEKRWEDEEHLFDVLSEKRVGTGRFMVFAPVEMFNGRGLRHLYEDADVVRQQMAELVIRLAKYAAGDTSVVYVE